MAVPQQQFQQPIGQLLIAKGVISEDQLRIATQEQSKSPQPLGRLLVRLGFLSEATIRDVLSENLGQETVDLATVIVDSAAVTLIPKEVARRYQLVPISVDTGSKNLTLAIADPDNIIALDQVRALLKDEYRLITLLASESDILRAIDQYYGFELSIDGILHEIEPGEMEHQGLQQGVNEFSQPVVRLIDALLTEAVQQNASDIHFEPENSFLRIRYRVDGVLRQVRSLHKSFWPAMVVRLKVMSGMNIAETRAPQDGRISLRLSGRPIDFRVASHPTSYGENLVLRILDRQKGLVPINQLGLDESALTLLLSIIAKPEGIVLVTGPTGSGKTTTLYAAISEINDGASKIITIEDPVEYQVPGVLQIPVNERKGLTFALGLRSILRHDPDKIMVGEIRDPETAQIAVQAALTGHLVFSTVHANNVFDVLGRFEHMAVDPYTFVSALNGIVAQRLVRVFCTHCHGKGCTECRGTGFKGRRAIGECLLLDDELRELIATRAPVRVIKEAARARGTRLLRESAQDMVRLGLTSQAEIDRITFAG